MTWLPFLLMAAGAVLLYLGGELLVGNASKLARSLGLTPLVIGLTVVAFGTSSPELFATAVAALEDAEAISLGNVLGSNIANLGLILGLSALLRPLAGSAAFIKREVPLLIVAALTPFLLLADGRLSRLEGVVMVALLISYVVFLLRSGQAPEPAVEAEYALEYGANGRPWWIFIPGVVGGLLLLVGGAHLLVDGAVSVARSLGISERVIGLTLVAFGTSLPELASSLAAARRREGDIVLGNVVGSNIFNVFCVLGLTVLVVPLGGSLRELAPELILGMLLSVVMVPMLLVGRRLYLGRVEGAILLAAYLGYVLFLFL